MSISYKYIADDTETQERFVSKGVHDVSNRHVGLLVI